LNWYNFIYKELKRGIDMLKSLEITGFFDKGDVELDLSENLTILTGDNGAGKTTILNIIFNILTGKFETLLNIEFEQIKIKFDFFDRSFDEESAHQLIEYITVEKIDNGLLINYKLLHSLTKFQISYFFSEAPFVPARYELILPEELADKKSEIDRGPFRTKRGFNITISDLVEKYRELSFINLLKESVIYFPTYRRIDSDIIQLIEQNYPVHEGDFSRVINYLPKDGRVVGVSDQDIDQLFKKYSDQCRKLNTEGLNGVLRQFIGDVITSTYKEEKIRTPNLNQNAYDKAPEQLIELSRQLAIRKIDETKIKKYFSQQKKLIGLYKNFLEVDKDELNSKLENKPRHKKNDVELKEKDITNLIFSINQSSDLIMQLINLYDAHLKRMNIHEEPYNYLERNFKKFFKDKINLNFFDYNLELSLPFGTLSTGEKQLITLLSYAALSMSERTYSPLIIMDEPELSLHISWQLKLLGTLLEIPDINLLLATHSPYIANSDYENYIWQLGDIDEY